MNPPSVIERGRPWPLGATVRDGGVNFAVVSSGASAIELCLFDTDGQQERQRLTLPGRSGDVWHGFVPGVDTGQVYGLRAQGPWRPDQGQLFNPHKLLLDPWAREIVGRFTWHELNFPGDVAHRQHQDAHDNAGLALKARVVGDEPFDWRGDQPPLRALEDSLLYEVHVRNFTRLMPGVPEAERGTYLGMASAPAIAHLKKLGVSAVSLLPVQQRIDEEHLVRRGLTNHWGYNTIGFFCPEPRLATQHDGPTARREFRKMVRALHAAGIEVLLDVVYNHTAEGDERGPSISWRGLDQRLWYRMLPNDPGRCENLTGCGNTLNVQHPRVLQFVLDSLRHWVSDYHVDGFRFDLAPVLGREGDRFRTEATFFRALAQDPLLSRVKLIAEPWDLHPGDGYQVGRFPRGWLEWNDRCRDTLRRFWFGGEVTRGEFARRIAGSSDLYQRTQRMPAESVNYVVSHDGFTLHDLVTYQQRRNEANGEHNADGSSNNLNWNCGREGETDDAQVQKWRFRLKRALLASVLLAQGTPMLAAGDELGHTQHGNNNPYCQDNETSWIDWSRADQALIDFTAHVIALRQGYAPFANRWYHGVADARGLHDLTWVRRHGAGLREEDWNRRGSRMLGVWIGQPGGGGSPLLLIVNARDFEEPFLLPRGQWAGLLDTTEPDGQWRRGPIGSGLFHLPARCLLLLVDESAAPAPRAAA